MGGNSHQFDSIPKGKRSGQTLTVIYKTHLSLEGLGEQPKRILPYVICDVVKGVNAKSSLHKEKVHFFFCFFNFLSMR